MRKTEHVPHTSGKIGSTILLFICTRDEFTWTLQLSKIMQNPGLKHFEVAYFKLVMENGNFVPVLRKPKDYLSLSTIKRLVYFLWNNSHVNIAQEVNIG